VRAGTNSRNSKNLKRSRQAEGGARARRETRGSLSFDDLKML
jgi:hypothetical protein